jgi:RNA polymerase sigma factor (sigma-70 family)
MIVDPLEGLLDKLCDGDTAAAEQVFMAYEPYLRKVVRKQLPAELRARFDSMDIVQSVWVDVLRGFREAGWCFPNVASLHAFLVKVTRNRFIDRVRQHQTSRAHEQTVSASDLTEMSHSAVPPPSQVAEADELWERLLALCPPAHHDLLRLKRQGFSLVEIAARTGMHEGSVRRILRTLAHQLACQQQPAPEASPKSP